MLPQALLRLPRLVCLRGELVTALPRALSALTTATPPSRSGQSPQWLTLSVACAKPAGGAGHWTTSRPPRQSLHDNNQRVRSAGTWASWSGSCMAGFSVRMS